VFVASAVKKAAVLLEQILLSPGWRVITGAPSEATVPLALCDEQPVVEFVTITL
jgi:hypothetical protein